MFGFDLRFALIPSKAVGIESYIYIQFHNTNTFVTIYSLEQSLFNSVYSGTLDTYFHRAAISLLAIDVEYFFKPLFLIILFLLSIQIPIQPLNLAGMNRTERPFLQCLP